MYECGHGLNAFGTHATSCMFGGQWITTHEAIGNILYALIWENGHNVWREWWYILMSRTSLWVDLYMIYQDHVFVTDVVVTVLTWKIVVMSVISRPVGVIMELSTIAKICKYRRFHERHLFILMVMEVHDTLGHDMDRFIREYAYFFPW